jgi:hypothetical protein
MTAILREKFDTKENFNAKTYHCQLYLVNGTL